MSKQTILYEATIAGNKEKIIDVLRGNGVDVKATDRKGDTLLHSAFKNDELSQTQLIDILDIFLDQGLDINAKNKLGKTILHLAVERRLRDVFAFCLTRNANTNPKHRRWNSIAHFAIEEECRKYHSFHRNENSLLLENESSSFIDWMVSQGIDFFYKKNVQEYSALYLANELNLQHIIFTLLKRVSDLASIEKVHDTPFLRAYLEGLNEDRYFYYHDKTLKPIPFFHYSYNSRYVSGIVKAILETHKSIDDKTLGTALHLSIAKKLGTSVVDMILNRLTSADCRHTDGESLIMNFTKKFHEWTNSGSVEDGMKILEVLILKGADLNERDRHGETVGQRLFRRHPKLEMLRLLKEGGADFGSGTDGGESCLHFISHHGNQPGMVELLIDGSCDVNARDSRGETPLQIAVAYANDFVAKDLIKHGANVNDVNKKGQSLLSVACMRGLAQVVETLIELGADLEYRAKNGKSLLHLAVDSPKVVELLVKNGMDVNAKDNMGKTPIHYAKSSVIKALVSAGAHMDAVDDEGNSLLYNALKSCQKSDVITELLKCGADIWEPKVIALAIEQFKNPYNLDFYQFRCIKQHLVKLTAIGLLDKIPYAPKPMGEELHRFYEQCQAEVALLNTFFIDDTTSLYKLLLKNRNHKCAYVNNEKLKALVEDVCIDRKFLKYFVLILGCYYEAVARKPVLEKAICIWKKITNVYLPDLCTDKIFVHLSNMELVRFVEAFENNSGDGSD